MAGDVLNRCGGWPGHAPYKFADWATVNLADLRQGMSWAHADSPSASALKGS